MLVPVHLKQITHEQERYNAFIRTNIDLSNNRHNTNISKYAIYIILFCSEPNGDFYAMAGIQGFVTTKTTSLMGFELTACIFSSEIYHQKILQMALFRIK